MNLEIASLFLIQFVAVVHILPSKIANKRGHKQVEAIEILS